MTAVPYRTVYGVTQQPGTCTLSDYKQTDIHEATGDEKNNRANNEKNDRKKKDDRKKNPTGSIEI